MTHDAHSVKEYLDVIPDERKASVKKIVSLIRKNAPGVNESFEHGMPFYTYQGPIFAVASQKNFISFYVAETKLVEKFKPSLGKVSLGKNCIRFKKLEDINLDAVHDLIVAVYEKRLSLPHIPVEH